MKTTRLKDKMNSLQTVLFSEHRQTSWEFHIHTYILLNTYIILSLIMLSNDIRCVIIQALLSSLTGSSFSSIDFFLFALYVHSKHPSAQTTFNYTFNTHYYSTILTPIAKPIAATCPSVSVDLKKLLIRNWLPVASKAIKKMKKKMPMKAMNAQ